jgi:hypothetical protein
MCRCDLDFEITLDGRKFDIMSKYFVKDCQLMLEPHESENWIFGKPFTKGHQIEYTANAITV